MRAHGLQNFGVSCWLNSILQLILSCKKLHKKIKESSNELIVLLSRFIDDYNSDYYYDSKSLGDIYRYFYSNKTINAQGMQDANEWLFYIINKIDNIGKLATYKTKSHLKCTCGHKTQYIVEQNNCMKVHPSEIETNLEAYIISNKKRIPDYKCDGCHRTGYSTYYSRLVYAPEILFILSDKYGEYLGRSSERSGTTGIYPNRIEIPSCTNEPHKYNLCAVINFSGAHYTCIGRRGKKIYEFNDQSVKYVSSVESVSSVGDARVFADERAYILLYSK